MPLTGLSGVEVAPKLLWQAVGGVFPNRSARAPVVVPDQVMLPLIARPPEFFAFCVEPMTSLAGAPFLSESTPFPAAVRTKVNRDS